MARIQFDIPEILPFSTQLNIRVSDLNYGNHLGNDAVLSIMHEARVRYLKFLGFTELDLGGVGIILTDTGIVYKSEGFYGQQITIEVGAGDWTKRGFDLYYRLINDDSGKVLAIGKTGALCFDYQARRVSSVPEAFRQAAENHQPLREQQ